MPRTAEAAHAAASMRARIGGYAVDMVIFAAIAMIVVVFAGFLLLATTDWAKKDPSDPQFYLFLGIIGVGAPLAWTVLNVCLLATRGQTGGQYVAAIRLVSESGDRISPRAAAVWWFCFNPLLFSWPMACVAGLPLAAVLAAVPKVSTLAFLLALLTICLASPLIALVSALLDGQHRALHDRIAGVVTVPAS